MTEAVPLDKAVLAVIAEHAPEPVSMGRLMLELWFLQRGGTILEPPLLLEDLREALRSMEVESSG